MTQQLVYDQSGNTLAIIAAALLPLLAMVGGSIDMGRSYLAQSRLQQACDAGVLAARKRMGSESVVQGTVPDDVAEVGARFFNLNYRNGAYASTDRQFEMTLESNQAITGNASVVVPTSIMKIFGHDSVDIAVTCQAQLNMANTDIMFVLDTTGSMALTNPGDTVSRIETLRTVVKAFMNQIETNKTAGAQVRFGFVPYSSNVNVGGLLKSDWMVDEWTYQTRTAALNGPPTTSTTIILVKQEVISGTREIATDYLAPECPANSVTRTDSARVYTSTSPAAYYIDRTTNGSEYACSPTDGNYNVHPVHYDNYVQRLYYEERTTTTDGLTYDYEPLPYPTSFVKQADGNLPTVLWSTMEAPIHHPTALVTLYYNGCIEERETYAFAPTETPDLTRALDLDIDLVPTPGNPATQWRPHIAGLTFARAKDWNNSGLFSPAVINDTTANYLAPDWYSDISACPGEAQKLQVWDEANAEAYLNSLMPLGQTYHDIGMIWGGRLLSSKGLFASENADQYGMPTNRHLIFLTDGQTEGMHSAYGAYGIEPLDQRRWSEASGYSLNDTIEHRFAIACDQVKKHNITVWVIAFGTNLNPVMEQCAGDGHAFMASNNAQLETVFSTIAKKMKELRITQ
ncbi:MAG: pilus assembly protein TadG-related protein [Sphingomonadaceae bacterium]